MYTNYQIDENDCLPILKCFAETGSRFMEVRTYSYHHLKEIMFAAVGTYPDKPTKRYAERVALHDDITPSLVAIFHIKIKTK